ncbi:MAG: hypothetical protein HZB71_01200 [Betaproteobacteria bacterium]|nr:hypothetical protein [Betaproteobacteria bacterium]
MSPNPFAVSSPEMMDAADMNRLFVPLSENFEIDAPGHVFIHGHRGCGKSMMLRQMAPDCLMLSQNKTLVDLPYLGLYATIKSTDLDLTDLERISNQYAGLVLAEHSLSLFVASKVLQSLRDHTGNALSCDLIKRSIEKLCSQFVINKLLSAGADIAGITDTKTSQDVLKQSILAIDDVYGLLSSYLRKVGISDNYTPYSGPLVGYRDFLFPFLCELTQLECMPKKPIYLLLDDADNLSLIQTQVLNNWVSFRTGNKVSFKISTQRGYKTWRTTTKQRIESPHDFKEVDISTIYTGKHSNAAYPKWVADVVTKRLEEQGVKVSVRDYFPQDNEQEEAINELARQHKDNWEKEGKGFRPGDDAYRYARPDYIKGLGAKQMRTYSYAGFDQLVHISSGIVRYFLDNAAAMYGEEMKLRLSSTSQASNIFIELISPSIQDAVVRNSADTLFFGAFDKLLKDATEDQDAASAHHFKQLRNLIQSLGGIFQAILLSDRSERRVFSIALSETPPDDVLNILELGVRHGYLYEAAIGTKDGRGRTRRFVMTRRLAPLFKLDPTGFSGYLFVTNQLLQTAMQNPNRTISEFESGRLGKVVDAQMSLELEL